MEFSQFCLSVVGNTGENCSWVPLSGDRLSSAAIATSLLVSALLSQICLSFFSFFLQIIEPVCIYASSGPGSSHSAGFEPLRPIVAALSGRLKYLVNSPWPFPRVVLAACLLLALIHCPVRGFSFTLIAASVHFLTSCRCFGIWFCVFFLFIFCLYFLWSGPSPDMGWSINTPNNTNRTRIYQTQGRDRDRDRDRLGLSYC